LVWGEIGAKITVGFDNFFIFKIDVLSFKKLLWDLLISIDGVM
jgi:hypothetical protein